MIYQLDSEYNNLKIRKSCSTIFNIKGKFYSGDL